MFRADERYSGSHSDGNPGPSNVQFATYACVRVATIQNARVRACVLGIILAKCGFGFSDVNPSHGVVRRRWAF